MRHEEARLQDFGSGLTPVTEGWYGDPPVESGQLGINVTVFEPGQTSLFHAEVNQEAFLVLSGECTSELAARYGASVAEETSDWRQGPHPT